MRELTLTEDDYIWEIAEIQEQLISFYESHYQYTKVSIALRFEMIKARLKHSQDKILITEMDQQLVAFIWGHFEPPKKLVQIEMLYVAENYRKQGYASKLKEHIETWAKQVGAITIEGTINVENQAMIELNKQLGYKVSHLKMSKDLQLDDE